MGKIKDLTGQKFGRLTAIERAEDYIQQNGTKRIMWLCQCECGNKTTVGRDQLTSGNTKSCGCIKKEVLSKNRFIDLTGQKFGRLTVIELHHKEQLYNKNGTKNGFRYFWLCQCDCGNITVVSTSQLKLGKTKSCGCLQKDVARKSNFKHGLTNTRIFHIYNGIKRRCYSVYEPSYKYYGARGIKVCDEWLDKENGFINFYNWAINNGYSEDLSIDRINVYKDYEPSNCRWANNIEQANNKRTNRYITYNNETKTLQQWAETYNISHTTLSTRLSLGWDINKALTENIKARNIEYNGETKSLAQWSRELNLNYNTLRTRINKGWNIKEAFETPVNKKYI